MPKAQWGGKITSSHATITETASGVVNFALKLDEITKISVGIIKHVGGGRRSIKFLPITGGIKGAIRGSGSVQEVYIYTATPSATEKKLLAFFDSLI